MLARSKQILEFLLTSGLSPDIQDLKGRSPLHHAFNNADTTANASFEIEQLLLDYKANINLID